jgi:hypothetical protein
VKDWAGGIDGLKNRSGKCEGLVGGIDRLKNRSGKCEGSGGGLDGLKNRSGKCEGPGEGGRPGKELKWEMQRTGVRGGGTNGKKSWSKRKVFLKNQKHQSNIVEITHLCIMHVVHTSFKNKTKPKPGRYIR